MDLSEPKEGQNNTHKSEVFRVEARELDGGLTSAHTIDHDTWVQVSLLLLTGFNCGFIFSFSNLMLVPLGWAWGLICLIVVGCFTAYANWLLAGFHIIDGQRFIRYRDLMGFVFGREMYYITWVPQFLTLLLGNMGFIQLGGNALKEINSEFSLSPLRLQYYIIMTGVVFFIFAFLVPTMSAIRHWLAISAIISLAYVIIILEVLIKDGRSNTNVDYKIKGSKSDKVFNAFGAITAIILCNTAGMLPEIQSTLRKPAVKNMRKALYLQFTVGLLIYYGVSIVGYWAYGSGVSAYLPKDLSGPKWAKIFINSTVFLQGIISQQIFVAPINEALDTKFLKLDEKMYSINNLKRRFLLRALVFGTNTFIAAAFPFTLDLINLVGTFTLFPLTFVFPSMIFIKLKGKTAKKEQKLWHWANIVVFSLFTVVGYGSKDLISRIEIGIEITLRGTLRGLINVYAKEFTVILTSLTWDVHITMMCFLKIRVKTIYGYVCMSTSKL